MILIKIYRNRDYVVIPQYLPSILRAQATKKIKFIFFSDQKKPEITCQLNVNEKMANMFRFEFKVTNCTESSSV